MLTAIAIVIAVIVTVGVIVLVTYNSLVSLRNKVEEGWAQIDVQLQRRAELIPNLVNTVKGYASHESDVLVGVTQARTAVQEASTPQEAATADAGLTGALGRLFAVAEGYPDLKASTNFLQLQEELTTTENKVSFARQYYNNSAREMNTKIQTVPSNIVAKLGTFPKVEYFEVADDSMRQAPTVSF